MHFDKKYYSSAGIPQEGRNAKVLGELSMVINNKINETIGVSVTKLYSL